MIDGSPWRSAGLFLRLAETTSVICSTVGELPLTEVHNAVESELYFGITIWHRAEMPHAL